MDWWTNNAQRRTIIISTAAGAVVGAVALGLIWALSSGQWKASGDGKTIFNTVTGELRYTASGRSVAEVNAERVAEYEANKGRYKEEQEQYEREQEQRNKEAAAEQLAKEQMLSSIRSHNSGIYYKVKKFVDDHPKIVLPPFSENSPYSNSEWERVTRPFRTGLLLTRLEHSALLDYLGRAAVNDKYKSDTSFPEAIAELKKWDFSNTW